MEVRPSRRRETRTPAKRGSDWGETVAGAALQICGRRADVASGTVMARLAMRSTDCGVLSAGEKHPTLATEVRDAKAEPSWKEV
jgi:hypothetical protein